MNELAIRGLAASLFDRRNEAVRVQRGDSEGCDWLAPKQCHRNAAEWCRQNPDCTAVSGWLVADYSIERIAVIFQFFAHSIVVTKAGDLIDLTPNPLDSSYPFLRHDPADGDFNEIVNEQQIASVTYQAEA
jgi:hypothetical protein